MFHSRALMRCAWGWPAMAAVVLGVTTQAQAPAPSASPKPPAPLTIAGDVPKPLVLSPADLKTYPRTAVTIQDEQRQYAVAEGLAAGGDRLVDVGARVVEAGDRHRPGHADRGALVPQRRGGFVHPVDRGDHEPRGGRGPLTGSLLAH